MKNYSEIHSGLSKKQDGSMRSRLFADGTKDMESDKNRERFFELRDMSEAFSPYLMHGNKVVEITGANWQTTAQADGFVTNLPNIALTITVADCFPVYFYDPLARLIGLAHCGWRGILGNLPTRMIQKFCELGAKPENIIAAIGPGILKCHFAVRDDVIAEFKGYKKYIEQQDSTYAIDLSGIISEQLKKQGVKSVESSGQCTYDNDSAYFSSRREGRHFGVMLAYISRREL